jgi:hypothetical protein
MAKRHVLLAAVLAAVCFLPAGLAAPPAKDRTPKTDDPPAARETEASDAVSNIALAYKLADYGRASKPPSPMALVMAADILSRIPVKDPAESADRVKVVAGGGPVSFSRDVLKDEAEGLIAEARKLNVTQRHSVVEEADRVSEFIKSGHRNVFNGPLLFTMRLQPHQTDTYSVKFKVGEWARVTIHAGGDARLSVEAVNGKGARRAGDAGHDPSITWLPDQDDRIPYKVTVTNDGPGEVLYRLYAN